MEKLFDLSQEYDSMLHQGLKISGMAKEYFIHGRIKDLLKVLPEGLKISNILDYGCGIGDTTNILKTYFKYVEITGTDLSIEALNYAKEKYSDSSIKFIPLNQIPKCYFDLVYVNGVFHHIEPNKRLEAMNAISDFLKPKGFFSFFENNPWNIGTKIIMKRIPFDRDAQPLNSFNAKKLLKNSGFEKALSTHYLFYFPNVLSFLHFIEKFLVRLPLGAQYFILARKNN